MTYVFCLYCLSVCFILSILITIVSLSCHNALWSILHLLCLELKVTTTEIEARHMESLPMLCFFNNTIWTDIEKTLSWELPLSGTLTNSGNYRATFIVLQKNVKFVIKVSKVVWDIRFCVFMPKFSFGLFISKHTWCTTANKNATQKRKNIYKKNKKLLTKPVSIFDF